MLSKKNSIRYKNFIKNIIFFCIIKKKPLKNTFKITIHYLLVVIILFRQFFYLSLVLYLKQTKKKVLFKPRTNLQKPFATLIFVNKKVLEI